MSILTLLHFLSFSIYLYLAGYVLYKNPKDLLNRVCAILILCFAIWSFGSGSIRNANITKDGAMLFISITSIGWCSFASFSLWFCLIFTKRERILKNKIIYPLFFL